MHTNTEGTVAVDRNYYWRPIDADTPRGVKLQVINRADNVAHYGVVRAASCYWTHWAPLPVFEKELP